MPRRKAQTDESEDFDDDDSLDGEKIQIRKPKIERIDKFKNLKKIVINVSMTQYSVVSEVAEELNWKIQTSNDAGDWDVYWTDFSIDPDVLIRMHLFQKINHFPGIHVIARKNLLGMNLTNMKKYYPDEYDFFPLTWMLPQQYAEFREYYETKPKGKTRTYIVKPEADCQGRGIFLTRKLQDLQNGKHYVVQRYIARPYLLDGLKFDFRIYVLLCGTNPLRLYMYHEGLARLATQPYHEPANANLDKLCMHLTNYAINKHNPKFIFNNNSANMGIGHKRSLSCVWKQLASKGLDVDEIKLKIKDLIIKTVITGLPLMRHQYKCSQPEDYSGNMCFHILGLDIMINSRAEPSVIQVNHTPSFTTDTPLDHKIKFNLIKDTLKLMNVNTKTKAQLYNRSKQYNTQRLLTGKRHIFQGADREEKIRQAQAERDKYEKKHMGGYEKIFPLDDPQKNKKYQDMIETSIKVYYQETNAVRNKLDEKEMKKLIRSDQKVKKKQSTNSNANTNNTKEEYNTSVLKKKEEMQNSERQMENQHHIMQVIEKQKICNNSDIVETKISKEQQVKMTRSPVSSLHTKPPPRTNGNKSDKFNNKIQCLIEEKQARISRFKRQVRRQNSEIGQKRQRSEQVVKQKEIPRSTQEQQLRVRSKHNTPGSQVRKSQKSGIRQFPNITDNSTLSQIFHRSQYQNHLKKSNNRQLIQSEPKVPEKAIQHIQRDMKLMNEKKMMLGGNGGYVMPKIFCINFEAERLKQQQQLNFMTMGKKINNVFNFEG